jgi:thiamine-monophosphate kinase
MTEHERIRALRALFTRPDQGEGRGARAVLGVGDDAAILELPGASTRLVVSVDDQVEGTHFQTGWLGLEDLGARATMAAASDVAAMGGRLRFILSSIAAPTSLDDEGMLAIARGQKRAAEELGALVVGGNLTRSPVLAISTTVIGEVDGGGLRRDGARPGDALWLAGHVGRAAAGLAILSSLEEELALEDSHVGRAAKVCLDAWRRPLAQQASGLAATAREATAAIDVSDGLAADAGHLAEASGVLVVIDAPRLVLDATLLAVAKRLHRDPLNLALAGGEDYALLVTAGPDVAAIPGFIRVGQCEAGPSGVTIEQADGSRAAPPRGWDHYR